jgi:DNA-binding GntR family transcriptional regulator
MSTVERTEPSPRLHPISRNTLWDRAYAALRSALLEGRYAPGERIVLRDVAEELGISLTPVRDAVNRLVAEKILARGGVGQGGGATVPLLDADQVGQLMTVRGCLEPMAAAAATRHATPEALDAVERALGEMKRAARGGGNVRYLEAHHRFHFGIYAMCRMPIVEQIIESAWLRCGPALILARPDYQPGLKRFEFHTLAFAALRRGDADAAAAAVRADIESARVDICTALEGRKPL